MAFIIGTIYLLLVTIIRAAPTNSPADTVTIGDQIYTIEPVTWTLETGNADTPTTTVNGTIEEAVAYIKANYNPDFEIAPTPTAAKLTARATDWIQTKCDITTPGWGVASTYRITQGISYLRGVKGSPYNGPGPGACGQVSCSWNSAILWCNDHTTGLTISSFGDIADGAQVIVDQCGVYDPIGGTDDMNGQVFNGNHWNVIARGGSC